MLLIPLPKLRYVFKQSLGDKQVDNKSKAQRRLWWTSLNEEQKQAFIESKMAERRARQQESKSQTQGQNWWKSLTPKQKKEYAEARSLADRMNDTLDADFARILDATP